MPSKSRANKESPDFAAERSHPYTRKFVCRHRFVPDTYKESELGSVLTLSGKPSLDKALHINKMCCRDLKEEFNELAHDMSIEDFVSFCRREVCSSETDFEDVPVDRWSQLKTYCKHDLVYFYMQFVRMIIPLPERIVHFRCSDPYAVAGLFRNLNGACVGMTDIGLLDEREPDRIFAAINCQIRSDKQILKGIWKGIDSVVNRTYGSLLGSNAKVALALFNGAYKIFWKIPVDTECFKIGQYPAGDRVADLSEIHERKNFCMIAFLFSRLNKYVNSGINTVTEVSNQIKIRREICQLANGHRVELKSLDLKKISERNSKDLYALINRIYISEKL